MRFVPAKVGRKPSKGEMGSPGGSGPEEKRWAPAGSRRGVGGGWEGGSHPLGPREKLEVVTAVGGTRQVYIVKKVSAEKK